MTDQLMSLEEINDLIINLDATYGFTKKLYPGNSIPSNWGYEESVQKLAETARAAHEWKTKYDARKVEVSAIVEENKSLRKQLATAKALVTALDNAFISSWQSTTAWNRELEAAKKSLGDAK